MKKGSKPQAIYFPSKSVKKLWEEKIAKNRGLLTENIPFKNFVGAAFLVNIIMIALVLLVQSFLPPQIPLYYGLPEGEGQLASSLMLVAPSLVSLLILAINISISYFLKEDFFKKTFILVSIGVTIFSAITTIKIILLTGSF